LDLTKDQEASFDYHLAHCSFMVYCWHLERMGVLFSHRLAMVHKEKLGERNLPSSFIKYFADKVFGRDVDPLLIYRSTAICFIAGCDANDLCKFHWKEN
jgi:hypothetical protein